MRGRGRVMGHSAKVTLLELVLEMKSPSVSYKMVDSDQLIWPHSSGGFQDGRRDGL